MDLLPILFYYTGASRKIVKKVNRTQLNIVLSRHSSHHKRRLRLPHQQHNLDLIHPLITMHHRIRCKVLPVLVDTREVVAKGDTHLSNLHIQRSLLTIKGLTTSLIQIIIIRDGVTLRLAMEGVITKDGAIIITINFL